MRSGSGSVMGSGSEGMFPTRSLVRIMILLQVAILLLLATSLSFSGPLQGYARQQVRVPVRSVSGGGGGGDSGSGLTLGEVSSSSSSSSTSLAKCLADTSELREQLVQCSQRKTEYRKEWGACTCKYTHSGPRGGYCVSKDKTADNEILSTQLADQLIQLFMNTSSVPGRPSVWDFGCGVGQYGRYFKEHAPDLEWQGFDGAEGIETKTDGRVKFLDLSEPAYLPVRDWSMSLEVGEHIPAEFEQVFMDNLHRHNSKGIVLSWGIPGQPGTNHINLHPNEHVIAAFTKRGYQYDQVISLQLRRNSRLSWFANTIMVFRRQ